MDEKEAQMFKDFQRYHWLFEKLENEGVFKLQFGKCTLNIAFGEIQNIVKENIVYKK